MRKNPHIDEVGGLLINPETRTTVWYHGSASCEQLSTDMLTEHPEVDHIAFFVSSSANYADAYATHGAGLEPNECRGLYEVQLKAPLRLFHADLLFQNGRLTEEGRVFLNQLEGSIADMSSAEAEAGLRAVAEDLDWSHFVDVEFYEGSGVLPEYVVVSAIQALGYDGWVERRTRGVHTTVADIAVFHSAISHVDITSCIYFGASDEDEDEDD